MNDLAGLLVGALLVFIIVFCATSIGYRCGYIDGVRNTGHQVKMDDILHRYSQVSSLTPLIPWGGDPIDGNDDPDPV